MFTREPRPCLRPDEDSTLQIFSQLLTNIAKNPVSNKHEGPRFYIAKSGMELLGTCEFSNLGPGVNIPN